MRPRTKATRLPRDFADHNRSEKAQARRLAANLGVSYVDALRRVREKRQAQQSSPPAKSVWRDQIAEHQREDED